MTLDTIYNEDCLQGMKRIPDGSIDAVICDLPYGTTDCAWDSIIPLDKLWEQYDRILSPKGTAVLFAQQPFTSFLVCSRVELFRHSQTWLKDRGANFIAARHQPYKCSEDILVFSKGNFVTNARNKATYNPQMIKTEIGIDCSKIKGTIMADCGSSSQIRNRPSSANHRFFGYKKDDYERFPRNYVYYPVPMHDRWHPTQKPVDLLRYLVLTYTNEGDTVLDNCMGSGTTAIACIKERRHFIGFELSKEYFDKAVRRIKAEQAQLTLF